MKNYTLIVLLLNLSLLTGCHQQNPLITKPKSQVVKFLYQAEIYASQKTHLYYSAEPVYIKCVNDPKHFNNPFEQSQNRCQQFFKSMLQYAQTQQQFSNLTLNNLANKRVIQRISKTLLHYQITH